jgi:hypothetical protein
MLDPVSAIGLTASIVQLITFSEGLFRRAANIYHSADGALVQLTELESVTSTFSELLERLQCKHAAFRLVKQTSLDRRQTTELESLVSQTTIVVDEISSIVAKVRQAPASSSRTWSSLRQALLSITNESKLKELERRLSRLKGLVDSSLLATIW